MGVGQSLFSKPRGNRAATMEEGEVQISDCHNYFISWALIRLTTNQVLDCQGLEQFARLLLPGYYLSCSSFSVF